MAIKLEVESKDGDVETCTVMDASDAGWMNLTYEDAWEKIRDAAVDNMLDFRAGSIVRIVDA